MKTKYFADENLNQIKESFEATSFLLEESVQSSKAIEQERNELKTTVNSIRSQMIQSKNSHMETKEKTWTKPVVFKGAIAWI